ncbi:hypothetical protein GW933_04455 [Candidatus Falkowbacteria bacterium]|uniref:ATP-dependent Clp protease proteolytic subunit n=1 Tax=Candidatus Buchananbacteria bacterium CG10_big_fil_rev_8_21_14_0_10_33_19 TaxID=1974525 RepID=A0A2H0W4Z3_9BACT|nr:hypothetical protein [Candidatus Falkowbacteria bacterium]PIS06416.1 MAG: hypothetical protein COT80_00535 [Candidatus Buchananbacteria bacterium CG10_big_fil_rev_8_21_14_0_10_33_19]
MWKYDSIDPIRESLLFRHILDLSGPVDEEMAKYVHEAMIILQTEGNPDIRIMITSNGGNVDVGLCIYDLIKNYPGHVTGTVTTFCRSVAMAILQACDYRLAYFHAHLKIHDVLVDVNKLEASNVLNPRAFAKFMEQLVQGVKKDSQRINNIYVKCSGQSKKSISQISKAGQDLSAEEALAYGLIDEIV